MSKAEYRSAIRSRKLINTALADLLLEKPLNKITVTDVVNKAEINRGTFYAHYHDIQDVINKMVEQSFGSIRSALSNRECTLEELPGILLRRVQALLEEDLGFYRKLMASNAASYLFEQVYTIILDYMLEYSILHGFDRTPDYDVKLCFCAGGISNLYRQWFSGDLPLTLDELTQKSEALIKNII